MRLTWRLWTWNEAEIPAVSGGAWVRLRTADHVHGTRSCMKERARRRGSSSAWRHQDQHKTARICLKNAIHNVHICSAFSIIVIRSSWLKGRIKVMLELWT
jgi:hypothetical protein